MPKDNATESPRVELKSLVDTPEGVLSSSDDRSKEEMSKIRSKAEHVLRESRHRLSETSDAIAKQTRETATKVDSYMRENPRTGVGIGAAVGVALGVLLLHR